MLADKIQNRTKNSNFIARKKSHTLTCLPTQANGFSNWFCFVAEPFYETQILVVFG